MLKLHLSIVVRSFAFQALRLACDKFAASSLGFGNLYVSFNSLLAKILSFGYPARSAQMIILPANLDYLKLITLEWC